MKTQDMQYNPTPGGIDTSSVVLCVVASFLKIGTILLDVAPALATIATVMTIGAAATTIFYNVNRYFKDKNKK